MGDAICENLMDIFYPCVSDEERKRSGFPQTNEPITMVSIAGTIGVSNSEKHIPATVI